MRYAFLILASLALAACSVELPGFLGREGDTSDTYRFGRAADEPEPQPVPVALRSAELERALHGVIVRAEGMAPTQGFYAAELAPAGGPDSAGIVSFRLVAVPPPGPEQVGPERTRLLTAAVFLPTLATRDLRGVRVAGREAVRTLPLR